MGNETRIDVIIPFHRKDRFLAQSVRAIRQSVGVKPRIILVDDRKSDDSDLDFDLRGIKLIRSFGVGYAKALNLGLKEIETDNFAMQDSDDLTDRFRLRKQLDLLNSQGLDFVVCQMRKITSVGSPSIRQPLIFRDSSIFRETNLIGSINSNSSWVCKAYLLKERNFLSERYASLDWATTLQLEKEIRVGFLNEKLYFYRQHDLQMTKRDDYKLEAFFEVFPLWDKLNRELGLPELSAAEAQMIAAPWSAQRDFAKFPYHWVKKFLKMNQVRDSVDFPKVLILIQERFFRNCCHFLR